MNERSAVSTEQSKNLRRTIAATVAGLCLVAAACSGKGSAEAGTQTPKESGYDVSFPQAKAKLPSSATFGIVGINGNLPNQFNPAFTEQANWARQAPGAGLMPDFSAYVTIANPGNARSVRDWPTRGTNTMGTCDGRNTQACSYAYGQMLAQKDLAYSAVSIPEIFIDVEPEYSWQDSTANNQAAIEGMYDTLVAHGNRVGIYASPAGWTRLVGNLLPASKLIGADEWLLGADDQAAVQAGCNNASFTGGTVKLVQIAAARGGIDQDYVC